MIHKTSQLRFILLFIALFSLLYLHTNSNLVQLQKAVDGFQITFAETPGLGFFQIDIIADNSQLNFYGVYDNQQIKLITNNIFQSPKQVFQYLKDYLNQQNILDVQKLITDKNLKINIHQKFIDEIKIVEAIFDLTSSQMKLEKKLIDRVKRIQHLRQHQEGDSVKQDIVKFDTLQEQLGMYQGMLKNGKKHGQGIFTFKSDDKQLRVKYEGQWINGIIQGVGKMTWKNKFQYQGQWSKGVINGKGIMIYCNGFRYQGQWKDGKRDGYGKMISPSGQLRFDGNWKNDMPQGFGFSLCPNGRKFEGTFSQGIPVGKATIFIPNGDKHYLEFLNGIVVNSITIEYHDGSKQIVPVKEGLLDGESQFIAYNGAKSVRKYQKGMRIV